MASSSLSTDNNSKIAPGNQGAPGSVEGLTVPGHIGVRGEGEGHPALPGAPSCVEGSTGEWFEDIIELPNIEPVDWAGERGGRKQQLLRLHRDEIVSYLDEHGVSATITHYGMMSTTLDKLVARSGSKPAREHLRQLERATLLAEISREESRATRLEVQSLKREYRNFTTLVATQVGSAIIEPLRRSLDRALAPGADDDSDFGG